jgi:GT2 family glycosyltransferase
MTPSVSVVLGTFERLPFLKLTIESLRSELDGTPHEIIVVDGGSADGTIQWLAAQKDVITIVQHNRGEWRGAPLPRRSWGYFMNLGFRAASSTYVCMVSDDCLLVPGAIKNGVKVFGEALSQGRKTGAVAFYWRNWPEANRYWVGRSLGQRIFVNHGLYLRSALETVGFIDDKSYFFYHADSDLALRLWDAGFECIASEDSYVEHFSHANVSVRASNSQREREDWKTLVERWTPEGIDPSTEQKGDWLEKDFQDLSRTAEKFRPLMGLKRSLDDQVVQRRLKPFLARLGLLPYVLNVLRALRVR